MQTITKTYSNLKAAHRQWRHPGHCHFAHGENWTIHITMGCHALDAQNFVVDYGKLRPLRQELERMFDHTLLIDADDPARATFEKLHEEHLCDLRVVESASAEGLCKLVAEIAGRVLSEITRDRVFVVSVVVEEDSKNTARLDVKHAPHVIQYIDERGIVQAVDYITPTGVTRKGVELRTGLTARNIWEVEA